jgi:hypothetical protein
MIGFCLSFVLNLHIGCGNAALYDGACRSEVVVAWHIRVVTAGDACTRAPCPTRCWEVYRAVAHHFALQQWSRVPSLSPSRSRHR